VTVEAFVIAVCILAGILIVGFAVTHYFLAAIHCELRRHRQMAAMVIPAAKQSDAAGRDEYRNKPTHPAQLPGEENT
jgi:hypothetical protein